MSILYVCNHYLGVWVMMIQYYHYSKSAFTWLWACLEKLKSQDWRAFLIPFKARDCFREQWELSIGETEPRAIQTDCKHHRIARATYKINSKMRFNRLALSSIHRISSSYFINQTLHKTRTSRQDRQCKWQHFSVTTSECKMTAWLVSIEHCVDLLKTMLHSVTS